MGTTHKLHFFQDLPLKNTFSGEKDKKLHIILLLTNDLCVLFTETQCKVYTLLDFDTELRCGRWIQRFVLILTVISIIFLEKNLVEFVSTSEKLKK